MFVQAGDVALAVQFAADLKRPEIFGETALLVVVQGLVAEHQNRVAVHGGADLVDLRGGELDAEVDVRGLGRDQGVQRCDIHGGSVSLAASAHSCHAV